MRPFGGFADQLREKTTNILVLAVLFYVVLSLAACTGDQRPPAGGLTAPTETIAVKHGPTQQATPAPIATALPPATSDLRIPSTPAGRETPASAEAPTDLPRPAPAHARSDPIAGTDSHSNYHSNRHACAHAHSGDNPHTTTRPPGAGQEHSPRGTPASRHVRQARTRADGGSNAQGPAPQRPGGRGLQAGIQHAGRGHCRTAVVLS